MLTRFKILCCIVGRVSGGNISYSIDECYPSYPGILLCNYGYDGATLRKRILMDNKDKFITHKEDGSEDTTQYQMASAMNVTTVFIQLWDI